MSREMTRQFLALKHKLRQELWDDGIRGLKDSALVFKVDETLFEEILEENRTALGKGIVPILRKNMKLYGVPIEIVEGAFAVEVKETP